MVSVQSSGGLHAPPQAGKAKPPPRSPYHDQLQALDIKPTGSAEGDLAAIQAAQAAKSGDNSQANGVGASLNFLA